MANNAARPNTMSDPLDRRIRAQLDELTKRGLSRALPAIQRRDGVSYELNGQRVIGLCSNDYLGLGTRAQTTSKVEAEPDLQQVPIEGTLHHSVSDAAPRHLPWDHATQLGATASRLVAGDLPDHREAEAALAGLLQTQDCVLFPSGYQANVSTLSALLQREDIVDCDELLHASLIDGVRLARAVPRLLPHLQPPLQGRHNESRSQAPTADANPQRQTQDSPSPAPGFKPQAPNSEQSNVNAIQTAANWWICESIYSMDGDQTNPEDARAHLQAAGLLYVDEAHSIGLSTKGRGWSAQHDLKPTIIAAPLGKAFGLAGAAIGCSSVVAHWLRTRARGFVFSTGILPCLAQHILHVIDDITGPLGDARRDALQRNIQVLAEALGLDPAQQRSPIFPVFLSPSSDNGAAMQEAPNQDAMRPQEGTTERLRHKQHAEASQNERALALSTALLARGFHVQAIRPPTVPQGAARLRVTVTALHTHEQLRAFAHELHTLQAQLKQ